MQIFALCCLLLCVVAVATETDQNMKDLAEEIRDVLADDKSNTDDMEIGPDATDNEREERREIDLRIIQDLLTEDERGLAQDIEERMEIGFREFMETNFEPTLRDIIEKAVRGRDAEIRDTLKSVAKEASDAGFRNFYCKFQNRKQPKFVSQLREIFDVLPLTKELVTDGCVDA